MPSTEDIRRLERCAVCATPILARPSKRRHRPPSDGPAPDRNVLPIFGSLAQRSRLAGPQSPRRTGVRDQVTVNGEHPATTRLRCLHRIRHPARRRRAPVTTAQQAGHDGGQCEGHAVRQSALGDGKPSSRTHAAAPPPPHHWNVGARPAVDRSRRRLREGNTGLSPRHTTRRGCCPCRGPAADWCARRTPPNQIRHAAPTPTECT